MAHNTIFLYKPWCTFINKFILFFMLFFLIISSKCLEISDLSPSTCGLENENKPENEQCIDCEYGKICSECRRAQTTLPSGHKHCQSKCYENQFGRYYNRSVRECKFCDKACVDGCKGPFAIVDEYNGCKRCNIGIQLNQTKKCLSSGKEFNSVCIDNKYKNYYLDEAKDSELQWTSSICRECDPDCASCSSLGKDPMQNKCECKRFLKSDGANSICSDICPDKFEILQQGNKRYKLCILCLDGYELDIVNGNCIKAQSFWSLKNILIISFIIILTILLAAFVLNLLNYLKKRYSKLRRPLRDLETGENYPLNDITNNFPEYIPGQSLDYELANNIKNQPRSSDDFIIPEFLIKIYYNEILGKGEFGIVYKGFYQNKNVAVKVIEDFEAKTEAYKVEGKLMTIHFENHPHLHMLLGISPGRKMLLVSELRMGSLKTYLPNHYTEFENELWRLYLYCAQIASGMAFLEEHNIIHRDLAARNVLVKNQNHVEVADFGLSKVIQPNEKKKIYEKVAWRWVSMEALSDLTFTIKNDVWAYGVTCWEIFQYGKRHPYDDIVSTHIQLLQILKCGVRLDKPENCDKKVFYEISECWIEDPQSRPTFKHFEQYFFDIENQLRKVQVSFFDSLKANFKEINKSHENTDDITEQAPVFQVQISSTEETETILPHKNSKAESDYNHSSSDNSDSQIEEEPKDVKIYKPKPKDLNMDENEQLKYFTKNETISPLSICSATLSATDSGYSEGQESDNNKSYDLEKNIFENKPKLEEKRVNHQREVEVMKVISEAAEAKLNNLFFANGHEYDFKFEDFQDLGILSDSRSPVKKYIHKPSSNKVAIKFFALKTDSKGKSKSSKIQILLNEIKVLRKMKDSKYIVKFYGLLVDIDNQWVKICMELMDFSLEIMYKKFQINIGFIPETLLSRITVCLVNALQECRAMQVMHGDLHQKNILVNFNGEIKLCDFRLSKVFKENLTMNKRATSQVLHDVNSLGKILVELSNTNPDENILDCLLRNRSEDRAVEENIEENPKKSTLLQEFIDVCFHPKTLMKNYQPLWETKLYVKYCNESSKKDIEKILDKYKFCLEE